MSPSVVMSDSAAPPTAPHPGPGGRRLCIPTEWFLLLPLAPVLWWYVQRLGDGSDEPFGLVPLVFAALLAWRDRVWLRAGGAGALTGAGLVLLAVVLIPLWPPLPRAGLAVAGAGLICGGWRQPGLMGLLVLSLPVLASLQFYLGYPLRLATADLALRLLDLAGLPVVRNGVQIELGGRLLAVDPACAGVRMLWHGLVAAMLLAAWHRLSWAASLTAAALVWLLVIPANALRAAWLAVAETGRLQGIGPGHDLTGLLCFVVVLLPVAWFAARRATAAARIETGETVARPRFVRPLLMVACFLTPLALAMSGRTPPVPPAPLPMPAHFTFHGLTLPLHPLPASPEERAFGQSFPGAIGVFLSGDDQVILRRVERATRKLHPAAHCLRAAGYHTTDATTVRFGDGSTWSRFHATRDGIRLTVHERVVSERDDRSWTDVSAWFWSALRLPLNGPWRAETVISR